MSDYENFNANNVFDQMLRRLNLGHGGTGGVNVKDLEWAKKEITDIDHYFENGLVKTITDVLGEVMNTLHQVEQPEKPVIPKYVADFIEKEKKERGKKATRPLNLYGAYIKIEDNRFEKLKKVYSWVFNGGNTEEFARAWLDNDYEVEEKYRFTLESFHEIDVSASSLEEAQKKANQVWLEYYNRQRDFGEPIYEGVVDPETSEIIEEADA